MTRETTGGWRATIEAALLAAAGALTTPVAAAPPVAAPQFAPPSGHPLILARKVVRELPGGAAIVATRRYRVSFRPVVGGWQVDGALIASEIDVPPQLSAIAALERDRPDDGLFPITLDHAGRILADSAGGMGRGAVVGALRAASQVATDAPADGFLARVGAAAANPQGGLTRWPEALFLPHGLSGTTEQIFSLPDGSAGSVKVSLASDAAPGMAIMGRAARIVVTQVAGTRREAREEWTLGPIAPPIKP